MPLGGDRESGGVQLNWVAANVSSACFQELCFCSRQDSFTAHRSQDKVVKTNLSAEVVTSPKQADTVIENWHQVLTQFHVKK